MNLLRDVRMHGAGNHFLIHVGEGNTEKLLANLGSADGLLLVQEDEEADAIIRIFNADGREAEQCGNGLRCVALHLVRSKLVNSHNITLKTLSGNNNCVVHDDLNQIEVTMCIPTKEHYALPEFPDLEYVNMGNPNAVFWTEDDPQLDRAKYCVHY